MAAPDSQPPATLRQHRERQRQYRRRQHSRPTLLKRLLEPVWLEIGFMLGTPLYRERQRQYRERQRQHRRRQHSRSTVLKRLLEPVWLEIRFMLRSPLSRWCLGAVVSLGVIFWLLVVVMPSSDLERFGRNAGGQITR